MFAELLFAFAIALVLVVIFAYVLNRPGPWGAFIWFFVVVFLGAWAVGVWARPVGPAAWGVAWVPILFGALIIALIIAAIAPQEPPRTRGAAAEEREEREETAENAAVAGAVGAFFWVLLIVLFGIVALAYAG